MAEIEQCQYGLWIEDISGWALSKKPTGVLTNPFGIAQGLQKKCPGTWSHKEQRHALLFGGKSKKAKV